MMYPRLVLLRELMAEDGSLWITIDDDEAHYLKVLCDEVFGRNNFVSNAVWQKKYSPQNDAKWLSDNHDHILIYAKNKQTWRPNLLQRTEDMNARYKNPDNDPRGVWKPVYFSRKAILEHTIYPITLPSGRIVNPPSNRSWLKNKSDFELLVSNNLIWFGTKGDSVPSQKKFLNEVKDGLTSMTIWTYDEVGHNQDAKKEIMILDANSVFDTPKPEKLIQKILSLATKENDLILDSFLGSGTTAAVAHKMNRRYIGIEMGEHAKTHCIPRLEKVIAGEQGGISKAVNWAGGGGFSFYTLGEAVFDADGHISQAVRFNALAAYIWLLETKTASNIKTDTATTPYLGTHEGIAYYLLYNGVLGDRRPNGGNVLTSGVLAYLNSLHTHNGKKIVFGEASRLGAAKLFAENISFKQIPYELHENIG